MKYSDEAVEKLIEHHFKKGSCPSDLGLQDANCDRGRLVECEDCWKQALAGEEK